MGRPGPWSQTLYPLLSCLSLFTTDKLPSKAFFRSKMVIKWVHRQSLRARTCSLATGPAWSLDGARGRTQARAQEAVLCSGDTSGPMAAVTGCNHQPEPWAFQLLFLTVPLPQVPSVAAKSYDSGCKTKASPSPLCSPGSDPTVSHRI